MGLLTKNLKGPNGKTSEMHGKYGYDGTSWDGPSNSVDAWSDFENEDADYAIAISLSEEDRKGKKVIDNESQLGEDEKLAKALQESLNMESPPQNDHGNFFPPHPYLYPAGYRICAGCNTDIGTLWTLFRCMGADWHPNCFRCHACNLPISDYDIPTNAAGFIEYRVHPFWSQRYCPAHELDNTPRCCSCERMEPRDTRYLLLDDGRKLCLDCLDSAIMDTHECQPLYLEIQEFFQGLNMKLEQQQIPLLLVERQALNEAMGGEQNGNHTLAETRGICLSEERTIRTILRRPRIGVDYQITDMFTEPYSLIRECEVSAILILYGLPRLLTGPILAHEMMHGWLRSTGYSNLSPEVEEGICQVLAHIWLDSEIMAGTSGSNAASTSSSLPSPSSSSGPTSSKKAQRSEFEKQLGEFFKNQIESDTSATYGDGYRAGSKAVLKYGLKRTLGHIRLTGTFPC